MICLPRDPAEKLLALENRLLLLAHAALERVINPDARLHIRQGWIQRHLMLQESRLHIEKACAPARTKPLSGYEAPVVSLHLNSYYLHVCGAFDNLAWALNALHHVVPNATEHDARTRRLIGLFRKSFTDALFAHEHRLSRRLAANKPWSDALRDLRDPAAHRIPVFAVAGVLTGDQELEEFRRLDQLAWQQDPEHGGPRRGELLRQARAISTYKPIMATITQGKLEALDIHRQVRADHRRYLSLSRAVLNAIGSDA